MIEIELFPPDFTEIFSPAARPLPMARIWPAAFVHSPVKENTRPTKAGGRVASWGCAGLEGGCSNLEVFACMEADGIPIPTFGLNGGGMTSCAQASTHAKIQMAAMNFLRYGIY